MTNIDTELRELLKKRYTSPTTMAEALHNHPGFEKLNRTTISRWLTQKLSLRQVNRAALAIKILKSKREAGILLIAEPKTLWVLPSTMLTWTPKKGTPYGLLASRYQVTVQREETITGGEALKLLDDGKVTIALAAREMVSLFTSVTRLCSMTKAYIAGISTRKIESPLEFKTLNFGHPPFSAIPVSIKNAVPAHHGTLYSCASAQDAATALLNKHVDAFVGWEPLISEIEDIIKVAEDSRKLYPIKPGNLGTIEIDVFINARNANPSVVRRYLLALTEAVRYVEERKSRDVFHVDIARRLDIPKHHIKSNLVASEFAIEELDLETVITLWEREVYDK